jgi:hypothetical protein
VVTVEPALFGKLNRVPVRAHTAKVAPAAGGKAGAATFGAPAKMGMLVAAGVGSLVLAAVAVQQVSRTIAGPSTMVVAQDGLGRGTSEPPVSVWDCLSVALGSGDGPRGSVPGRCRR